MKALDASELIKLNNGLKRYENAIPQSLAKNALRSAARPMLLSAQRLVPVSDTINGGKLVRGGATRRDLRIKIVKQEGEEIARVIVGVSGASGKVGWRTHFITHGWTDRGGSKHRGRDFLQSAYDYTIDIVKDNFYRALFDGFIKWGNTNLPQGK